MARYNEFRRSLLLIPISKWEDLTDDNEAIETLKDVYGDDVEELDLLVGLMAEKKITGFAISETAFVIFLLMASRYGDNIYCMAYAHTNMSKKHTTEITGHINDTTQTRIHVIATTSNEYLRSWASSLSISRKNTYRYPWELIFIKPYKK